MAWFARKGHTSPNALNTVLVKLRVATEKRDPFYPRLYRNESIERVFMAAKWQRGYRERVTGGNVEKANPGGLEILQDPCANGCLPALTISVPLRTLIAISHRLAILSKASSSTSLMIRYAVALSRESPCGVHRHVCVSSSTRITRTLQTRVSDHRKQVSRCNDREQPPHGLETPDALSSYGMQCMLQFAGRDRNFPLSAWQGAVGHLH